MQTGCFIYPIKHSYSTKATTKQLHKLKGILFNFHLVWLKVPSAGLMSLSVESIHFSLFCSNWTHARSANWISCCWPIRTCHTILTHYHAGQHGHILAGDWVSICRLISRCLANDELWSSGTVCFKGSIKNHCKGVWSIVLNCFSQIFKTISDFC